MEPSETLTITSQSEQIVFASVKHHAGNSEAEEMQQDAGLKKEEEENQKSNHAIVNDRKLTT